MASHFFLRMVCALSIIHAANSFPTYGSLAGLSAAEIREIMPTLHRRAVEPPPGPMKDTSAKLVFDPAHPFIAPKSTDIRGPCPGLNTLASHGYLPRNGIATPAQIVNAVQEGFNMGNDLAIFVTYAAFLVDGNLITNLLSIGGKTSATGPDPPAPASVAGLNTHAVFEGDASTTRGDAFFGDNHSFNETLFDELTTFSNKFGAGFYNLSVAAEFRFQRIQDSIATNPQFSFISPRYFTAYAESVFPVVFFVDGRQSNGQLDMNVARGFFQTNTFPQGFFRSGTPIGISNIGAGIQEVFLPHPIAPGGNNGAVNTFTPNPNSADFTQFCKLYTDYVTNTVRGLYPTAEGPLLDALNANLNFLYQPLQGSGCPQVPAFT
ncbi:Cloroperoxidase [Pholiota conissans]|uniref:Cloroperoxidase n=1 Tax=Pholiota conissans TaxID=109636 RepID=A0A9P6D229_9AGAR|nr:Cloroperoxidase [Pholiota conissans]